MTRTDIINDFIKFHAFTSYLEIGVRNKNDNFNHINCNIKIGVDPDKNAHADFVMTSDNFFSQNTQKFDIIFIDGLHEAHQVYKDIRNSLKFLNKNGIIVCHDCNPCTKERAKSFEEYIGTEAWNGDCWKGFVKYRFESEYECYVLNQDEGCGIIDTTKHSKILHKQIYDIGEMTYSMLEKDRKNLLDLR